MKEWPEELAAAVGSVELLRVQGAKDQPADEIIKLKLWNKPQNLRMLFEHMGCSNSKSMCRNSTMRSRPSGKF